ncbi:MAG TPA: ATP-binding protein [Thermodesulfobacteriota bacterium]|nr:ATP-binding protein [Thermodesulfobacteriota bacterium]
MTRTLLWKLLGINILVIGSVIVIVWMAIDYLAAGYFMTLMEKYHISPTSSQQMFLSAVHRYLIWASLAALFLAVVLSILLMRKVLRPLRQMTTIAQKISSGDYSDRVPFVSGDEVGQLASSFNRMADSLRLIEGLRKTLMIDVAHELRTPLTNIRGYLEALTDGVAAPTKETFDSLQEETMRLIHLVEDVLRLAKADAARMDLHKTDTRMEGLILQELDIFRPQFDSKKISIETQFSKGSDRVLADRDKIAQVVTNLLQNAYQYTPTGGFVRISTEQSPREFRVVLANTGGELSQNDLPFIFERFYRGEKSRSREHGGAGIGLAIVKELIEAHDGHVGAEISGKETRIWFSIPV